VVHQRALDRRLVVGVPRLERLFRPVDVLGPPAQLHDRLLARIPESVTQQVVWIRRDVDPERQPGEHAVGVVVRVLAPVRPPDLADELVDAVPRQRRW